MIDSLCHNFLKPKLYTDHVVSFESSVIIHLFQHRSYCNMVMALLVSNNNFIRPKNKTKGIMA